MEKGPQKFFGRALERELYRYIFIFITLRLCPSPIPPPKELDRVAKSGSKIFIVVSSVPVAAVYTQFTVEGLKGPVSRDFQPQSHKIFIYQAIFEFNFNQSVNFSNHLSTH